MWASRTQALCTMQPCVVETSPYMSAHRGSVISSLGHEVECTKGGENDFFLRTFLFINLPPPFPRPDNLEFCFVAVKTYFSLNMTQAVMCPQGSVGQTDK